MASNSPKVWLITGASSGLGAALALHVLKAGHKVIATARNASKAAETYPEISKLGGTWITLDVNSPEVETIVSDAVKIYGTLDVVVNNAGYSVLGACEDISDHAAHDQMETNFFGALKVIRGALPALRGQKSGCIVNITSVAGIDGLPTCSLYAGSKFALEGASESLARELAPFNIRVLLVEPGAFRTNFAAAFLGTTISPSAPYQTGPVADVLGKMGGLHGIQQGDPEKAAARILDVVAGTGLGKNLGHVLRLPLGDDCVKRFEAKIEALRADLERTREIAATTAF